MQVQFSFDHLQKEMSFRSEHLLLCGFGLLLNFIDVRTLATRSSICQLSLLVVVRTTNIRQLSGSLNAI